MIKSMWSAFDSKKWRVGNDIYDITGERTFEGPSRWIASPPARDNGDHPDEFATHEEALAYAVEHAHQEPPC